MSWAMHQEAFSEISYTTDYGRHPFDLKLICWSRWVHFISYAHAILIDSSPSHLHVAASSYYSCQHGAKPFRTAENELLALDPEYSERNTPTASIIDSTILLTKLCHHVGPCMRDAFIPSSSTQFIAIIPRPARPENSVTGLHFICFQVCGQNLGHGNCSYYFDFSSEPDAV